MVDRMPTKPGRVEITREDGGKEYVVIRRADEPTEEGTPLSKATLLDDATARLYGLSGVNAVPSRVFSTIHSRLGALDAQQFKIGDIAVTKRSSFGANWLKLNGSEKPMSSYPELARVLGHDTSMVYKKLDRFYNLTHDGHAMVVETRLNGRWIRNAWIYASTSSNNLQYSSNGTSWVTAVANMNIDVYASVNSGSAVFLWGDSGGGKPDGTGIARTYRTFDGVNYTLIPTPLRGRSAAAGKGVIVGVYEETNLKQLVYCENERNNIWKVANITGDTPNIGSNCIFRFCDNTFTYACGNNIGYSNDGKNWTNYTMNTLAFPNTAGYPYIVIKAHGYWVALTNNRLYYTKNIKGTWTEYAPILPISSSLADINYISGCFIYVFNKEVYCSYETPTAFKKVADLPTAVGSAGHDYIKCDDGICIFNKYANNDAGLSYATITNNNGVTFKLPSGYPSDSYIKAK